MKNFTMIPVFTKHELYYLIYSGIRCPPRTHKAKRAEKLVSRQALESTVSEHLS